MNSDSFIIKVVCSTDINWWIWCFNKLGWLCGCLISEFDVLIDVLGSVDVYLVNSVF